MIAETLEVDGLFATRTKNVLKDNVQGRARCSVSIDGRPHYIEVVNTPVLGLRFFTEDNMFHRKL